jgi:hypothetical protein
VKEALTVEEQLLVIIAEGNTYGLANVAPIALPELLPAYVCLKKGHLAEDTDVVLTKTPSRCLSFLLIICESFLFFQLEFFFEKNRNRSEMRQE